MKSIEFLSELEKEALLKFPVYISLLAANSDNKLDEEEKKYAIKLSHIKTYSCDPLLAEFYGRADKVFEKNMQQLDKDLPIGKTEREVAIKKELMIMEKLVMKLGEDQASVMHRSMKSFKEHVSKSYHSVLVDFIFPMPIEGLSY